jgi:hypothetical protein
LTLFRPADIKLKKLNTGRWSDDKYFHRCKKNS